MGHLLQLTAICLAAVLLSIIGLTSGQVRRDREKQIKDLLIGRNYDPTIIPSITNGTGPVRVNVSATVKKLLCLDTNKMALELQLSMKLRWNDARLAYTAFPPNTGPRSIQIPSSLVEKIWTPNLHYENALQAEVEATNQYIKIFLDNGNVEYNFLVRLTTNCPMNLAAYPHDVQNCFVKIASFGHSKTDVSFEWDHPSANSDWDHQPSQVSEYRVQQYDTRDECENSTNDDDDDEDDRSCIQLHLRLGRMCEFYLLHVYIPCTMLIIVSWLSYFIHPKKSAIPRTIVAISALILAVLGVTNFNQNISPRVSYTKAIDIWTGISLTFIFLSVIEFVVVNYLNEYECCHKSNNRRQLATDNAGSGEQNTPLNAEGKDDQDKEDGVKNWSCCAAKLDIVFRIGIAVLFKLFVIAYFLVFVAFA